MKRATVSSIDLCDDKSTLNFPKLVRLTSSDDLPTGLKFAAFRSSASDQLMMSATTGDFHYLSSAPPRSLYLAAVDRNSGECRLSSLQSFTLAPMTALSADSQLNQSSADADAQPGSRKQALHVFGLQRSRRKMERWEKLRVTDEQAVVGESLKLLEKEAELKPPVEPALPGAQGSVCEAAELLAPPCNWQADSVEEVYSRADVVPDPLWKSLVECREEFSTKLAEAEESCLIAKYINSQLSEVSAATMSGCHGNQNSDTRQLLVSYAFYLLRMLQQLQKRAVCRKWSRLGIPEPVLAHMRASFMERSVHGWDRSERLKDKLVCHFLVVAMWIHRYTIDLTIISPAAGIGLKNLTRYAVHLGMRMKKNTAELRVPLVRSQPNKRDFRMQRAAAAL